MRPSTLRAGALLISSLLAAGAVAAQAQPTSTPNSARAVFLNAKGDSIGTATLIDTPNGVLIRADVANLPPGIHGFHIHETGKCEPGTGFSSAGGHFDPEGKKHGYMNEGGPHAGDMPNQHVADNGRLLTEVFNPRVRLKEGKAALLDADGSALVIHRTADDYRTDPAGTAGERLACGMIRP